MKDYIKNEIKHIPTIIVMFVLFYGITTLASSYLFKANEVEFDNTNTNIESTNVGDAIDELYTAANNFATYDTRLQGVETKIGSDTLNTTSSTLTGGINEVNSNITNLITFKSFHDLYSSGATGDASTLKYIGLSVTIPKNAYYCVDGYVVFANAVPQRVIISQSNANANTQNVLADVNGAAASVCGRNRTSSDLTLYLWVKNGSTASNPCRLEGAYWTM